MPLLHTMRTWLEALAVYRLLLHLHLSRALRNVTTQPHIDSPRPYTIEAHSWIALSSALFSRFVGTYTVQSVQDAIVAARGAVHVSSPVDARRAALLYALAELLMCRFELLGWPTDLVEAVSHLRNGLRLLPAASADCCALSMSLAKVLHLQFLLASRSTHLVESINVGRNALSFIDPTQPERAAICATLSASLLMSYRLSNISFELDQCLEYAREAISSSQIGSWTRPVSLDVSAQALLYGYRRDGNIRDAEAAIAYGRAEILLCPSGAPGHVRALTTLAAALLVQFQRTGQVDDLKNIILLCNRAIERSSPTMPIHAMILDSLIPALIARFVGEGLQADLDAAFHHGIDSLTLRPLNHVHRPRSLINLALVLYTRFTVTCNVKNLDDSANRLHEAIALLPPESADRMDAFCGLSDVLCHRFIFNGTREDIEESIKHGQEALRRCNDGAPGKARALCAVARAFAQRFEHTMNGQDLDSAMELYEQGLACCLGTSPLYLELVAGYWTASQDAVQSGVRWDWMSRSNTLGCTALNACPLSNLQRATLISLSAYSLVVQFGQSGLLDELDKASNLVQDALQLYPEGTTSRLSLLHLAAFITYTRYGKSNSFSDLENSIELAQIALASYSPRHLRRYKILIILGGMFQYRFQTSKQLSDLTRSIEYYKDALVLCPVKASIRPSLIDSLASLLNDRFTVAKRTADLEAALSFYQQALLDYPTPHPMHSQILCGLATSWGRRFEVTRVIEDLSNSIMFYTSILDLPALESQLQIHVASHLARALRFRFQMSNAVHDIEGAIKYDTLYLSLCPPDHPQRMVALASLAYTMLHSRWLFNNPEHLKAYITFFDDALAESRRAAANPHSLEISLLFETALMITLARQYLLTSDLHSLNRSICMSAQLATSTQNVSMGPTLTILAKVMQAEGLHIRYTVTGHLQDLEDGIRQAQNIVATTTHSDRRFALLTLAEALTTRFTYMRQPEDLEDSIKYGNEALSLCPQGHPNHSVALCILATSMDKRFAVYEQLQDSDKSLELLRQAAAITGELWGVDQVILLNNLMLALHGRWRKTRNPAELDEGISNGLEASKSSQPAHFLRARVLANLAWCYQNRFDVGGRSEDLDQAILNFREALHVSSRKSTTTSTADLPAEPTEESIPESEAESPAKFVAISTAESTAKSPYQFILSVTLNHALLKRYNALKIADDLKESIARCQELLPIILPDQHPLAYQGLMINFATSLYHRYCASGVPSDTLDIDYAIGYCQNGCLPKPGRPVISQLYQLRCAMLWARLAHSVHHYSTGDAYSMCLQLLQRNFMARPTLEMQHQLVLEMQREAGPIDLAALAANAAAYAISQDKLRSAVDYLEQGRALIWSQIRRLRTPLDKLSASKEHLRDRFIRLNKELDALGTSSSPFLSHSAAQPGGIRDEYGSMLETKRRLTVELDEVISEIRQELPNFLMPATYCDRSSLEAISAEGPVIIINHSVHRSDALIISQGDDGDQISCIKLSDAFYAKATEISSTLLLRRRALSRAPKDYDKALKITLQFLAEYVADPVMKRLKELGVSPGSRIWWCPTSVISVLPLHAAGPLEDVSVQVESPDGKIYLSDLYISSYTPTLTALLDARRNLHIEPSGSEVLFCAALLGDKLLKTVKKEIKALRKYFEGEKLVLADGSEGGLACNRETVLAGVKQHRWVHFACHGTLETQKPLDSAFKLGGNERLTLQDLIEAGLHQAELAVLSACHTAEQAHGSATEEVLHLAAAMQFCGFRGVVGTMWEMLDADGSTFADVFYGKLSAAGLEQDLSHPPQKIRFKMAAQAVQAATRELRLRNGPKMKVERWVNFVHIGA